MNKMISLTLAVAMIALTACGGQPAAPVETPSAPAAEAPAAEAPAAEAPADLAEQTPIEESPLEEEPVAVFKTAMVAGIDGVHDGGFNQSAWEGLQKARDQYGMEVKLVESNQESDYASNIDSLVAEEQNLIWGIGSSMSDAFLDAALNNLDRLFAVADYAYAPEDGINLIGVVFKTQDAAFEVGYMAARTTTTGQVGFIGGLSSDTDPYEYGYRGGVAYAAKERGMAITVDVQYVGSGSDDATVEAVASQMYADGADVLFAVAGDAGKGLFEAAKAHDRLAIGVDRDQSELAPENTLTSALKLVGNAMCDVSKAIMDGKDLEYVGTTRVFGLAEGGVGIPDHSLATPEAFAATKALEAAIAAGRIEVPFNEETLAAFETSLQ